MSLFVFFNDSDNVNFDEEGIIHDVRTSKNGFIFYIDTGDLSIRCFSKEKPEEYGYYGLIGSYSDDGGIFFVERMMGKRCNN